MYDDEEEIKRKRRNLILVIVVIVTLILLLLLFLFIRTRGHKPKDETKTLACELEVKSGNLGEDNIYTSSVEIGFKSITAVSKDIKITKNTVGTTDNARNKDTYTINKKGNFKVYGYIEDEQGNQGTCSIEVNVNPTVPTCELEITKGTVGSDGWYKSDVVVGFKSKDSNSTSTTIAKYYIEVDKTELDTGNVVKSDPPTNNIDTYTVKDNQITNLTGYVIDSSGNEGTCSITVKKDSEKPTCTLKVLSGTKNSEGLYTTNVLVGFASVSDKTSDIASQGVGTSKNYTQKDYTVTANGKTVVYGYVKDKAGNEGTCNITIERPTPTAPVNPTPPVDPTPTEKESIPTCELTVVGTKKDSKYIGTTKVQIKYSTTNGAAVTGYGINTTANSYNSKTEYTISKDGTYTIWGSVKDSYGHTGNCKTTISVQMEDYTLAKKVQVGDTIAYDAGSWNVTMSIPTVNGNFGGYSAGTSKNSSVKCQSNDTSSASGWQVISISDGKVTIVHKGMPECYYHDVINTTNAINAMNNKAKDYMNQYAESARALNYNDITANGSIKNIGSTYYLATATDSTTLKTIMYSGRETGRSSWAHGIRPVITLKANVETTGKNSNGAWVLTFNNTKGLDNTSISSFNNTELVKNILETIKNTLIK